MGFEELLLAEQVLGVPGIGRGRFGRGIADTARAERRALPTLG